MRCVPPMASQENGLALSTGFLPSPVDPRPELNNAAPSLQLHYRTFITTTSCPAPVPRIGTPILAGASRLDRSLRIGATGSHGPCKSPVQVHAAFMPDAVWAAIRTPPRLVPGNDGAAGAIPTKPIAAGAGIVNMWPRWSGSFVPACSIRPNRPAIPADR